MRVRGGSAFGMAAAYAFRFVALDEAINSTDALFAELARVAASLLAEKPTMATIHNAIDLVVAEPKATLAGNDLAIARDLVTGRANRFIDHSRQAVDQLGRVGIELVAAGHTIMERGEPLRIGEVPPPALIRGCRIIEPVADHHGTGVQQRPDAMGHEL